MSHSKGKKETKHASSRTVKPEAISGEQMKKHATRGTIKGNE